MLQHQGPVEMSLREFFFGSGSSRKSSPPQATPLLSSTEVQTARSLSAKLQNFDFPEPGLTNRLIEEQGWDRQFIAKAKQEYLRFIVLATSAPTEVTPSLVVDEVWHTHLMFSKSYIEDLCLNNLERIIHHSPGTGEATHDAKYQGQYLRTLATYKQVFGQEAPSDLWPRPKQEATSAREKSSSHLGATDSGACAASPVTHDSFFLHSLFSGGSSDTDCGHGGSHDSGGCGGAEAGGADGGGASSCGGGASCGGGSSCGGGGCGGGGCGGS